jgi:hypothetical protein
MMPRATCRIAWAAGSSGSASTRGVPASECSRRGTVSGTWPSNGTSSSSASNRPPPSPKIWKRSPPGVVKPAMFSTTPAISSLNLIASSAARRATRWAAGCGVVHEHELRLRQELGQRHRHVAGARREVDDQVVELAPRHVLEELLERLVEHRPAPDHRAVLFEEEADRHHLHAMGLERQDLALGRHLRPLRAKPEHAGIE